MATVHVGEFEWDDGKAKANLEKHDVSFEEAMTVFLDELALPLRDAGHPERLVLIGEWSQADPRRRVHREDRRYHSDHRCPTGDEGRAESL